MKWKPKVGDYYFYVTQDYQPNYINAHMKHAILKDGENLYKGNYFETEDEAKKLAEKINNLFH
jgi:hypothetical protein